MTWLRLWSAASLLVAAERQQGSVTKEVCDAETGRCNGRDDVDVMQDETRDMETSLLQRGKARRAELTQASEDGPMYKGDEYNTPIPASIMTPESVKTPIGTFNFSDGIPDESSVELAYKALDFTRGVSTFLNWIPAASLHSLYLGWKQQGGRTEKDWGIFSNLMDSNSLFLTGNMDTVYAQTFVDLEDGPVVVEVPPGMGPSTVNDAFFRFVEDMGAPGPDRGKGGKYLIVGPPETYAKRPLIAELLKESGANQAGNSQPVQIRGETYFVAHSNCYINWVIARGLLAPDPALNGEASPGPADKVFRENVKAYKLEEVEHLRDVKMNWINNTNQAFNTIHANDFEFYKEIHEVIEKEPYTCFNRELLGQASAVGIEQGKPFAPSEDEKRLLTQAVASGNAIARALSFEPRNPDAYIYGKGKSQWLNVFIGGDYRFLRDGGAGGMNMDARVQFFYLATVNTPAMVKEMIGVGSQYGMIAKDSDGEFFDGSKTYTLTLPPNVPAKDFWSLVVYDPQTRSMLQAHDDTKIHTTGEISPGLNSLRSKPVENEDGSVTAYFAPELPAGVSSNNWVKTVSSKRWFMLLRLYGPLQPYFDGKDGKPNGWRPGEVIKVTS